MKMQALDNYNSQDNSYLVNNYPYGGKRCRIRFWVEYSPKKGFRFCSQTENPKTLVWNKPKASTYSNLAGQMCLDDKGHVQCERLSHYCSAQDINNFITNFPNTNTSELLPFITAKIAFLQKYIEGKVVFSINGQSKPLTEAEIERDTLEVNLYRDCLTELKLRGNKI